MGDRNKTDPRDAPVTKADWAASTAKSPDDFAEQDEPRDEPMTEEQAEHLKVLSKEANVPFPDRLTRGEAERRIDELQRKSGNKP